jgi:probable F420-dependent oxidoreductase
MDFWLPLIHAPGDDTDQIFETAQTAEAAGFAGIALIDHVVIPTVRTTLHPSGEDRIAETMPFFDVFTTAAALAAVTRTIRFTSYSYVLPLRDPFSVAKQVATAAILSNFRVSLGVGVGWFFEEMDVMGVDRRTRGRRVDEMLEIIADFWDDGYCEHHGDLFDLPLSAMFPIPEAPIPVWIGGMSDRALERAAHHDGWMADAHPLTEVVRCLRKLRRLRQELSRQGPFEALVAVTSQPSADLYRTLADEGATSVIALPWDLGSPEFVSTGARRASIERFAAAFIS